jgi:hypothetical protein
MTSIGRRSSLLLARTLLSGNIWICRIGRISSKRFVPFDAVYLLYLLYLMPWTRYAGHEAAQ